MIDAGLGAVGTHSTTSTTTTTPTHILIVIIRHPLSLDALTFL